MRATLLRGRDQTELEGVRSVGPGRCGVALSRGGAPKTYPYTDPNEDAALCAQGERGLLVAVADGHWGCEASERVLETLRANYAEPWTEGEEPHSPEAWARALEAALGELHEIALSVRETSRRAPRTTLALALARPAEDLLVVASAGDSHVFRVEGEHSTEVTADPFLLRFLGSRSRGGATLDFGAAVRAEPLGATEALVAVTDGLSESGIGVPDPAAAVAEALRRARRGPPGSRAEAASRALVEIALEAQRKQRAGDNVAAAVAWLAAAQVAG